MLIENLAKFGALCAAVCLCFIATPTVASAGGKIDKKSERLWRAKCASCHGRDGKAKTDQGKTMKMFDMTTPKWQSSIDDAKIRKTMVHGVNRKVDGVIKVMPPFKAELTPEKMSTLLKVVRSFGAK